MRGSQKNKNYKIIWGPDLAYAIGLLTTDGNLSNDGRHLTLVSKDKQLLKTFKNCLGLDCKIALKKSGFTGKQDCYRVQFGNTTLYKYLLKIGLHPNKSKTIEKLEIPDKYFFDFLRGCFDGDGCFYSYWDRRWESSFMFYTTFSSGSLVHLKWLRSRIKKYLKIKGYLSVGRRVWQLRYAKKESKILISKIYYREKLPCLKRKYKKLKTILNIDDKEINRTLKLKGRVMEPVDIYG